jgi:hypothetical protein
VVQAFAQGGATTTLRMAAMALARTRWVLWLVQARQLSTVLRQACTKLWRQHDAVDIVVVCDADVLAQDAAGSLARDLFQQKPRNTTARLVVLHMSRWIPRKDGCHVPAGAHLVLSPFVMTAELEPLQKFFCSLVLQPAEKSQAKARMQRVVGHGGGGASIHIRELTAAAFEAGSMEAMQRHLSGGEARDVLGWLAALTVQGAERNVVVRVILTDVERYALGSLQSVLEEEATTAGIRVRLPWFWAWSVLRAIAASQLEATRQRLFLELTCIGLGKAVERDELALVKSLVSGDLPQWITALAVGRTTKGLIMTLEDKQLVAELVDLHVCKAARRQRHSTTQAQRRMALAKTEVAMLVLLGKMERQVMTWSVESNSSARALVRLEAAQRCIDFSNDAKELETETEIGFSAAESWCYALLNRCLALGDIVTLNVACDEGLLQKIGAEPSSSLVVNLATQAFLELQRVQDGAMRTEKFKDADRQAKQVPIWLDRLKPYLSQEEFSVVVERTRSERVQRTPYRQPRQRSRFAGLTDDAAEEDAAVASEGAHAVASEGAHADGLPRPSPEDDGSGWPEEGSDLDSGADDGAEMADVKRGSGENSGSTASSKRWQGVVLFSPEQVAQERLEKEAELFLGYIPFELRDRSGPLAEPLPELQQETTGTLREAVAAPAPSGEPPSADDEDGWVHVPRWRRR